MMTFDEACVAAGLSRGITDVEKASVISDSETMLDSPLFRNVVMESASYTLGRLRHIAKSAPQDCDVQEDLLRVLVVEACSMFHTGMVVGCLMERTPLNEL